MIKEISFVLIYFPVFLITKKLNGFLVEKRVEKTKFEFKVDYINFKRFNSSQIRKKCM